MPWWKDAVDSMRRASPAELPSGYAAGDVFTAPVVAMPVYMKWLEARVVELGGAIETRGVSDLEALLLEASLVVNCTGLYATAADERRRPASHSRAGRARRSGVRRPLRPGGRTPRPAFVHHPAGRLHGPGRDRRGGRLESRRRSRDVRRDPGPVPDARAGALQRGGPLARGRPAPRPQRSAPRDRQAARRGDRPQLRSRRRGRHAVVGVRGRGRAARLRRDPRPSRLYSPHR